MTRLNRIVPAIFALVLAASAAPAFAAVKGDCLWNGIPAQDRADMINGYRTKGIGALGDIQVKDEWVLNLRQVCSLKAEEDYTAGEVLGAMILEKGADAVLFERNQVPKGSLDKAWRGLSANDREALTTFGLNIMKNSNEGVEAAGAVVFAVTGKLGLPTGELNTDVFAYLLGRAIREAREAGRT
ncbi:MAG: hypothetical protein KF842_09530 [Caulobacter sp.]|nr:hypothetical protein [Caulobacter sp.]